MKGVESLLEPIAGGSVMNGSTTTGVGFRGEAVEGVLGTGVLEAAEVGVEDTGDEGIVCPALALVVEPRDKLMLCIDEVGGTGRGGIAGKVEGELEDAITLGVGDEVDRIDGKVVGECVDPAIK